MDREDLIETLNDLIENCKDGEYGFATCADYLEASELKALLRQRAEGCQKAAHELQVQIVELGGSPDTGGSASGAAHRGWVRLRGSFAAGSDRAVLDECERGEDIAVARYRAALEKSLPPNIAQLVRRQYEGALRNHDEIKSLRDSLVGSA